MPTDSTADWQPPTSTPGRGRYFATLRSLLTEDVTFDGPLAQLDNADDCVNGLEGMSQIMTAVMVHKTFVDGGDVLAATPWSALRSTGHEPALDPAGRHRGRPAAARATGRA